MAAIVPVGGAAAAADGGAPGLPAPDGVVDPAGRSSSRTVTDTILGGESEGEGETSVRVLVSSGALS